MNAPFLKPTFLFLSLVCFAACKNNNNNNTDSNKFETFSENEEEIDPRDDTNQRPYNDKTIRNTNQTDDGGLVTLIDPNEQAFSISMPNGWTNEAYSVRSYEICRFLANSTSPDGRTYIAIGDAKEPWYVFPTQLNQQYPQISNANPLQQVSPFVPAEQYFPAYLQRKFGRMADFQITDAKPDPEGDQLGQQKAREKGLNLNINCMTFLFSFSASGEKINGLMSCSIMAGEGIWGPSMEFIFSKDDPTKYKDLLRRIGQSSKANPAWEQQQNARHEQRMAQLRADHQARMNGMVSQHNLRMQAIQQAGDASTKNYNDRMASQDANHRNFINMIREENTVQTSGGQTYQVDGNYQRYYYNRTQDKYIGTDVHTSLDDLRKFKLNPDDYEEMNIIK
jgi:hypothetical protein